MKGKRGRMGYTKKMRKFISFFLSFLIFNFALCLVPCALCPAYCNEGYNEWDNVEISRGPQQEFIIRANVPDDVFVPAEKPPSPVYEITISKEGKIISLTSFSALVKGEFVHPDFPGQLFIDARLPARQGGPASFNNCELLNEHQIKFADNKGNAITYTFLNYSINLKILTSSDKTSWEVGLSKTDSVWDVNRIYNTDDKTQWIAPGSAADYCNVTLRLGPEKIIPIEEVNLPPEQLDLCLEKQIKDLGYLFRYVDLSVGTTQRSSPTVGVNRRVHPSVQADVTGKSGVTIWGINPGGPQKAYLSPNTTTHIEIKIRYPKLYCDKYKIYNGQLHEYARIIPADYDPDRKYPLIMELHGFGSSPAHEIGFDKPKVGDYVAMYPPNVSVNLLPSIAMLTDSILVAAMYHAPDEGDKYVYGKEAERFHFDLINLLKQEYNIDEDRIWLFGTSMGGYGILNFSEHRPDCYAGIAGGGVTLPPLPPLSQAYEKAMGGKFEECPAVWEQSCPVCMVDNLLNVCVVYGHGVHDGAVPLKQGRALRDKFQLLGYPDFTYLEFPDAAHCWRCWGPTCFKAQGFMLKGAKRNPAPKKVVYKTNDLYWNKAYWVKIDELSIKPDEELEKPLEDIYEEIDDLGLKGQARGEKLEEEVRENTKFGKVVAEKFISENRISLSTKYIARLSLDLPLAGLKQNLPLKINLENQSPEPVTLVLTADWTNWAVSSVIEGITGVLAKGKDYEVTPKELTILNLTQSKHSFVVTE